MYAGTEMLTKCIPQFSRSQITDHFAMQTQAMNMYQKHAYTTFLGVQASILVMCIFVYMKAGLHLEIDARGGVK